MSQTNVQGNENERRPSLTRVFLSYSRSDEIFAVWLRQSLEEYGIEVFRDLDDTLPGEEWWGRLKRLIEAADTVIFILSPRSVSSKICGDEVGYAEALKKRIFPAVIEAVDWASVPNGLATRHSVFFNDESVRTLAVQKLTTALLTDIAWVREHTRLFERSTTWHNQKRIRAELLSGKALDAAERWLTEQPRSAEAPTALHHIYIKSSRDAARRWRNIVSAGLVSGLILATGLAGIAWRQREFAVEQGGIAEKNAVRARDERDKALVAQSRLLAKASLEALASGNSSQARLIALEALPSSKVEPRPYIPEAETALRSTAAAPLELFQVIARIPQDVLDQPASDLPRDRLLVYGGNTAAAANGNTIIRIDVKNKTHSLIRTRDSLTAIHATGDGNLFFGTEAKELLIMDMQAAKPRAIAALPHDISKLHSTFDGRLILVSGEEALSLFDAESSKTIKTIKNVDKYAFSEVNGRILYATANRSGEYGWLLRTFDPRTNEDIAFPVTTSGTIAHLAISTSGDRVVIFELEKVTAYDFNGKNQHSVDLPDLGGEWGRALLDARADAFVVCSSRAPICLSYNFNEKQLTRLYHQFPAIPVAFGDDTSEIVTKSDGLQFWSTSSQGVYEEGIVTPTARLRPAGEETLLKFTSERDRFITLSQDGGFITLKAWRRGLQRLSVRSASSRELEWELGQSKEFSWLLKMQSGLYSLGAGNGRQLPRTFPVGAQTDASSLLAVLSG